MALGALAGAAHDGFGIDALTLVVVHQSGANGLFSQNGAMQEYDVKNLVLAGGVAANSYLRERFSFECDKNGINFGHRYVFYIPKKGK